MFFLVFSADPLSNMLLQFDTKEEAIAFAVRNGEQATTLNIDNLNNKFRHSFLIWFIYGRMVV